MEHGIEIYLNQLNTVEVAADGKTVTIGGGTQSKKVTDTLWASNKQTGMIQRFFFCFSVAHDTNH
jgi:hypothetical protein